MDAREIAKIELAVKMAANDPTLTPEEAMYSAGVRGAEPTKSQDSR